MDQEQLRKAIFEKVKIEYLLDGQWIPAEFMNSIISLTDDTSSQNIVIELSQHNRDDSGVISLSEDDIENRLRVKDPN